MSAVNQSNLINELKKVIGNENVLYSKVEWVNLCLKRKFVKDSQSAEELFEKFDSNNDGFINIFDIGRYCQVSKENNEFQEEDFINFPLNKLISENLRNEERILSFFKTIQTQYPTLQKYFEDLLIDIIGEISEIKKEYEKLEFSYNKEKSVSKEKLKEIQDDLESWFNKYENEMKQKLAQYENQIKSIKSEKGRLLDEIEYYKNLQKETKVLENSGTDTMAIDFDLEALQTSLRESESVKTCYASKLKFLENELIQKDDELESVRTQFKNACDNCQTLDVSLQNLVYANRRLNDDNDQLRSTLISLSNTNSNKSYSVSQHVDQFEVPEAEDSGLSTQIEFGDTDNEHFTLNKIKRIHSFLSNQDKTNHFSYSCDSDNIDSPVHGPFRNMNFSKFQAQNKVTRRRNGPKSISENTTPRQSQIGEKLSLSSLSSSDIVRMEPERMFKIILAGDSSVGKTCFMLQFCKNTFDPVLPSTVGIDYHTKTLFVDGRLIALQIWDTAGQEKFRSIVSNYFRRVDGILLMYDIVNVSSFLNVRCWIDIIRKSDVNEFTPIMLLANKIDMRNLKGSIERSFVKKKEGESLAKSYGLMFKEISVKEKINVNGAIIDLARKLKAKEDLELSKIHLADNEHKSEKKCCSRL